MVERPCEIDMEKGGLRSIYRSWADATVISPSPARGRIVSACRRIGVRFLVKGSLFFN
jgi:hypothetical protein